MPEYARVCQSMPDYARVCQSMPEYARVCQSMLEYARVCQSMPEYARVCQSMPECPVLKINDHATGGRRTKDILGGPKGWGPKKTVANVEIYVIFEVFAFCGGRTKTDFKDQGYSLK